MRAARPLTEQQKDRALTMRRNGDGYSRIAARLDSNYTTVRCLLDPEYRERKKTENRDHKRRRSKSERRPMREFPRPVIVPDYVEDSRIKRCNAPRTLTSIIMGDPPPGYSALDQKRREGRA